MEEENNTLESILNNVTSVATGVPAPIQRSLFKAFAQLCSASVDIPAAYFEGKAAIIRATTTARIKAIEKISENLSDNISVPIEFSNKAIERYGSKIVRQQINLDRVVDNAATNLTNQNFSENVSEEEISEEWLDIFEEVAKIRSSQDMQLLFGKILANEISKPGSFSYRTLNLVAQLDSKVSELFLRLCNACMYVKDDDGVSAVVTSDFESKTDLDNYDLQHFEVKILEDYGLLHSSHSQFLIGSLIDSEDSLYIGHKAYKLSSSSGNTKSELGLNCRLFTEPAKELYMALTIKTNRVFLKSLKKYLNNKGFTLEEDRT